MEEKTKELFARIPIKNIKFEDSYEQSKFDQIKLAEPHKAIDFLENVLTDEIITISFN